MKLSLFRERIISKLKRQIDFLSNQLKTLDYKHPNFYLKDYARLEEAEKELEIQLGLQSLETYSA